jgi:hypothetical protein
MHEFEAMLFSDCDALAGAIQKPSLAASFQSILAEFGCPEAINDGIETAPSKRILQLAPEFDKLLHGSIAATRTGLDKIRAACPHFNQWLDKLESLGSAQEAQPT